MAWKANMDTTSASTVRVELSGAVLLRLLRAGHLGASDLRCLDCPSRRCLRRLCLDSCKVRRAGGARHLARECPGEEPRDPAG